MMRGGRAHILALTICAATPLAAQEFTTLKGHGGPVMDISVADDGQVATASFDNSIALWDGAVPRWLEGHDAAVTTLLAAPGLLLSGGDDFRVLAWFAGQDTPVEVARHQGKVSDLAYDAQGGVIASASWDGSIAIRQITGTDPLTFTEQTLTGHSAGVTALAFSAIPDRLYSASSDGTIRLWDLETGAARVIVKHGFGINRIVLNEALGWLAYGAVDGVTRVVQPQTGAKLADFSLDRRPILAMSWHAETAQLAVGDGQGYIMIIDTDSWRIARDFRATRRGPIWALAHDPAGQVIYAGGLDDVVYAWPVALLDEYDPVTGPERSFQRDAARMPNGERQFMRKCSICHALEDGPSRKAGPTLHGVFGRRAGTVPGYRYSTTLDGADIVWSDQTIDQLFDLGPDHYIPGSKMPMQRITAPQDRRDLINFLKIATK